MADIARLNDKIAKSGLKKAAIAQHLGITPVTFSMKTNGHRDFTLSEVVKLSKLLQLTEKERDLIFF